MTDHDHGPHGDGCSCHLDPLPGPRIRFDVLTPDPETAAKVVEQLARQAVGYATDGMAAIVTVIPNALEVDHDTQVGWET